MKCEFEFCIYQKDNQCILKEPIEINELGMCDCCITPIIDKDILTQAKEKVLKQYAEEEKKYL